MCCKSWKTILPFVLTFLVGIFGVIAVKKYTYIRVYETAKTTSIKIESPNEVNGGKSGACYGQRDSNNSFLRNLLLDKTLIVTKSDNNSLLIISKPRGIYTEEARKNQTQGIVRLRVQFLSNGYIGSIFVVNDLPDGLTEQAIAAARKIEFEPQRVNGLAKTVTKSLEYSFILF